MTTDGRRAHYGTFYGLDPLPAGPIAVVHGNCQAESLRITIGDAGMTTVRLPPVHEMAESDLAPLRRLLVRTSLLITQPVRDDYRDLPVGSRQLQDLLPTSARTVTVPVVRYSGLYPFQVIVRPTIDPSSAPPLVPYHDLRTLSIAAGESVPEQVSPEIIREIADRSLAELRRRESAHRTVQISDLFETPSFELMRTLNHPGNPVFLTLAERVLVAAGLSGSATDPGRPLLNGVHAPREESVMEALGISGAPVAHWIVDGTPVDDSEVRAAHLRWYADHPDAVSAGLQRHRELLMLLGSGGRP